MLRFVAWGSIISSELGLMLLFLWRTVQNFQEVHAEEESSFGKGQYILY